ncbi:hypothetical protein BTS2_3971 [Bacillus sp. TS-2]|nr:hypothetical protein BTS2_3971 [Bacillus sp. TS-2]
MDRKKAQQLIGKTVLYTDQYEGTYLAHLKDIMTEPRKPFRALIEICCVVELPLIQQNKEGNDYLPLLNDAEEVNSPGQSLHEINDPPETISFDHSLLLALESRLEKVSLDTDITEQVVIKEKIAQIHQKNFQASTLFSEVNYYQYTYSKNKERYVLKDDLGRKIDLDDCPFELEWVVNNQKFKGYYIGDGQFESTDPIKAYTPTNGAHFYIHKQQFDPYTILKQELEPQALSSFEKSLKTYELSHLDLIECHNTLLRQLLEHDHKNEFSGVNFLTYKNKNGIIMVLHHYERILSRNNEDKIYDRFEFTTENGKRSIFTYTNEYSL